MNLFNLSKFASVSACLCFFLFTVGVSATETKNDITNTPKGFDPFIWAELQKLNLKI